MTKPPTIRDATERDVPTIFALIKELAGYENAVHEVKATESSLLSTLSFPSNPSKGYAKALLIVHHDDDQETPTQGIEKVAGLALYFYNYSTWRGAPGIYLEDLFVRPSYRGKGYGKALLQALAKETLEIGGKRLEWNVLKWNESGIRFYEGIGARGMKDWMGMRVDGEGLNRLAGQGATAEEGI